MKLNGEWFLEMSVKRFHQIINRLFFVEILRNLADISGKPRSLPEASELSSDFHKISGHFENFAKRDGKTGKLVGCLKKGFSVPLVVNAPNKQPS